MVLKQLQRKYDQKLRLSTMKIISIIIISYFLYDHLQIPNIREKIPDMKSPTLIFDIDSIYPCFGTMGIREKLLKIF